MALEGKALLGRLHRFYIEPTADLETPVWEEYGKLQGANRGGARDVSEIKERDLIDTTVLLGHRNTEISLTITRRPGNDQFDALEAAANADPPQKVGIAMMTGDITEPGERGFMAEMYVTQWDDDQAHDSNAIAVTLRPAADYDTAPEFVEIPTP